MPGAVGLHRKSATCYMTTNITIKAITKQVILLDSLIGSTKATYHKSHANVRHQSILQTFLMVELSVQESLNICDGSDISISLQR